MRFVSIAIIVLLTGCSRTKENPSSLREAGSEALQLSTLNDEAIPKERFDGKVLFVNIWATWCGPCIRELPAIERLRQKLDSSKVSFVYASNETAGEIKAFAEKRRLVLPFVRIHNLEALGVQVLPTTYIFDRSGTLRHEETGMREWDAPEQVERLQQLIAE
jgi:thiol-disulfide isomerase/thioredoxin